MDYSWEEELTPDMLGDNLYCTVAKAIGVENLLRLAKIIGGSNFYMPIAVSYTHLTLPTKRIV